MTGRAVLNKRPVLEAVVLHRVPCTVLACMFVLGVFRETENERRRVHRVSACVAGESRAQEAYRLGVDDDSTTGSREGEICPMLPYV